jgi:hypothetical protein
MAIRKLLREFGKFHGHLVILWSFGIFFHRFCILYQENLANPIGDSNIGRNLKLEGERFMHAGQSYWPKIHGVSTS